MAVHPTLHRLNSDWHAVAQRPAPSRWAREPALAGHLDPAAVLASIRARPDDVLAALLRCGDLLARRVVLQAMLGRAVLDAARDSQHDLDDYIAELWLGICDYPLSNRPTRIAANLALDTAKRVRARPRATPVDPLGMTSGAAPDRTAGEQAHLVLARARRAHLLDQAAHAALTLVYAMGLPGAEAARLLGVTPGALRQRCRRAVRLLAAHADQLGEVA